MNRHAEVEPRRERGVRFIILIKRSQCNNNQPFNGLYDKAYMTASGL